MRFLLPVRTRRRARVVYTPVEGIDEALQSDLKVAVCLAAAQNFLIGKYGTSRAAWPDRALSLQRRAETELTCLQKRLRGRVPEHVIPKLDHTFFVHKKEPGIWDLIFPR